MLDRQSLLLILGAIETGWFQDSDTLRTHMSLEKWQPNCMNLLIKRRVIVELNPDPVC